MTGYLVVTTREPDFERASHLARQEGIAYFNATCVATLDRAENVYFVDGTTILTISTFHVRPN